MIVVDTSVLYALLDRRDGRHRQALTWYESFDGDLATTPLVLAETDHLASTRAGAQAARAFRRDVAAGVYAVEWWPRAGAESVKVAEGYRELGVSLTDASLVALAARISTTTIATFDERHFRAVRPARGGRSFRLLPADAGS
ncbi:MAG: PIN domain-containing protein [Actinobacteria bacterium]|nr:PIN domain-containing protein [Actinomycetota bacterium]